MQRAHLVTGATGFVGRALVLELLARTQAPVVCLVRADGTSPQERLWNALLEAAEAYDCPQNVRAAITQRCHAVAGDIRSPGCGLPDELDWRVDQVWHSAASLRFHQRDGVEIDETNVEGTRRVLELAKRLDTQSFNYISTAYVAGRSNGLIQADLMRNSDSNNCYETSKRNAEEVVLSTTELQTRILRPSVVIGHSRTHAVCGSYTGLYGLIDRLAALSLRRATTNADRQSPVRIRANPEGTINLFPVDLVVEQAVRCAQSSSEASVFHLTTATPLRVSTLFQGIHAELGLPAPQFVSDAEALSLEEKRLARQMSFYASYLRDDKAFDRATTDQALGTADDGRFTLTEKQLRQFCHWYLTLRRSAAIPAQQRQLTTPGCPSATHEGSVI